MTHDNRERMIALAGIYQSIDCVDALARHGSAAPERMQPCLYSLLQTDAPEVSAVYGAPGALEPGARVLTSQLIGQPRQSDLSLTRYLMALLRLERALSRRRDLLAQIARGIDEGKRRLNHFELLHDNLFAHFAAIYSQTLSQLQPRIIVRGEGAHLRNPATQNRIRTLLLAGVRSAMLWRQIGGSRWQLLLSNKRLLDEARAYLDSLPAPDHAKE